MLGIIIVALEILYFKWDIKFPTLSELMLKGGKFKKKKKNLLADVLRSGEDHKGGLLGPL